MTRNNDRLKFHIPIAILALALAAPFPALASAAVPTGAVGAIDGGAFANPALILEPLAHEPYACAAKVDGAIALTGENHLCLCDGSGRIWRDLVSRAACHW